MEEAFSERRMAFATAHKSGENRQAYIFASRFVCHCQGRGKADDLLFSLV